MRARGRRRAGLIGVAAAVAVVGLIATVGRAPARLPDARPSAAPPAAVGPVLFYELLDAAGSRLVERRLDGTSLPRVVATRPDADHGQTWIVDPTGTLAVAVVPDRTDQRLIAHAVGSGAVLWDVHTPLAPIDAAVWTADGSRFAISTAGDETEPRRALVVGASTGAFVSGWIPEDSILQGFDRQGGLVVRSRLDQPAPGQAPWGFLRLDLVRGVVDRLVAPPDVPSAGDWNEDVAPGAGQAVDTATDEAEGRVVVRLWSLAGGAPRPLATFASTDRLALDPAGGGVAVVGAGSVTFVGFDGAKEEVFGTDDFISQFSWSDAGDYLLIGTEREGPNLTLVERATGRAVTIPQAARVAQSLFVRLLGGVPLPASPLPASEPGPTPTAPPGTSDAPGFPGLIAAWTDADSTGAERVHVDRVVPTEDGGMRVAASMPALDIGGAPRAEDGPAEVRVLPRPGSDHLLVWVNRPDGSRGWLWDGHGPAAPLVLPDDWPEDAYDVTWRPDGRAIAASAGRATDDGAFEGVFVIARIDGGSTTWLPIVGDYDRLEGWWSVTELRVGHGICTEGCAGRYADAARLRVVDGRLRQLTPADRGGQPIDQGTWVDGRIVLSLINDDARDDIVIEWPADRGPGDEVEVLGFVGEHHTLVLARPTESGFELLAVDDPVGRARDGRLTDPSPRLLAALPPGGVAWEVSADLGWAIVRDRVEDVRLVRLADGRSWPLDRDRLHVWR